MSDDRKNAAKKRRRSGCRCVMGECSNTADRGAFIHELPGPARRTSASGAVIWTKLQQDWIRFIKGSRAIDPKTYTHIFICSAHFDQSQYDESQVQMYRLGLRKKPPQLKPEAVPHLKANHARHPFPPEWFMNKEMMAMPVGEPSMPLPTHEVKRAKKSAMSDAATGISTTETTTATPTETTTATPTETTTATPTETTTATPTETTTATPTETTTATPTKTTSATTSALSLSTSTGNTTKVQRRLANLKCLCKCRCRASQRKPITSNKSQRVRSRSDSIYSRKKDVSVMYVSYLQRKAMERAKDVEDRSKGDQYTPKMVTRKVQANLKEKKPKRRSCGAQVRPRVKTIGLQADITFVQPPEEAVQMATTGVQTILRGYDLEPEDEEEDDISSEDDHDSDCDWEPVESSSSSSDDEMEEGEAPSENVIQEKKYIVFERNLLELFKVCIKCQKDCLVQKHQPKSFGSNLKIVSTCSNQDCQNEREWYAQPKMGDHHAGNICISSAILYAGGSPTKVLRVFNFMNLGAISMSTFMSHQREYLQPAIVQVWKRQQQALFHRIVADGGKVTIGGDGRSDSPGHCAKFGSYTFMDMKRGKVVDLQLVQSNEVSSSYHMEKEGLARGLEFLTNSGLEVERLITDRHAQVAKWLRETYPAIDHRYDVWHIAKGLKKKIKAVAKQQDCELAAEWKRSILNHVYWSASSTTDGDGEMMVAKYKSVLNHVRNIHEGHSDVYPKCLHSDDYPAREWMKEGTKVFDNLSAAITPTRLLNDMKKMSHLDQTSSVESFHSVLLYWCPKMLAFSDTGMKCRLYLAGMHWNENGGRGQACTSDGTPRFKISYPKPKEGGHIVSRVLTACTYNYVEALMSETLRLVTGKLKLRSEMEELTSKPPLCANFVRPDKMAAVEGHEANKRFKTRHINE